MDNPRNPSPDTLQIISKIIKHIFIASSITLFILTIHKITFPQYSWPQSSWLHGISSPQQTQPPDPSYTSIQPSTSTEYKPPITRFNPQTDQTACYPSSGGIWISHLGPVELQQLQINRFETSTRSWDAQGEDHFCRQLRVYGGSWYNISTETKTRRDFEEEEEGNSPCNPLHNLNPVFRIRRLVGFPETGGVLVLTPRGTNGRFGFPEGTAVVGKALSMEERCMVLERLGAVFCEDVEGCSVLGDLRLEPWEWAEEHGLLSWRVDEVDSSWCGTF
ncbi:hypothetical protein BDW62DRAFT_171836 [Aspergillus aurantiobrunneus]